MNKDAKGTLSLCCGIVRKGWQDPSVMHDGLCREKHGGDLGKTYWLMDSGLQIDHEAHMAYMEWADMVAKLRQYADIAEAGEQLHLAQAMRDAADIIGRESAT
jgi:hypothetical protein